MFSSCSSMPEPVLLTAEGGELWVDFTAGEGNYSAGGFQLSLLSIPDDLRHVIEAVQGNEEEEKEEEDSQMKRIRHQLWGTQQGKSHLVNHLLTLLSGQVITRDQTRTDTEDSPLIEVVEDTDDEQFVDQEYSAS